MVIAVGLHILAAVVWVGGMFFAHMALRPAVGPLEPPQRLPLLERTLGRFFQWVWASVVVLLLSGYWMILIELGGFAAVGVYIHIMQGIGIAMMLIFLHVYFAPFRRLRTSVAAEDWPAAGAAIGVIRQMVAINLALGLVTAVIGATGRYWG